MQKLQKHGEIYGALKCLLLREHDDTNSYFQQIQNMEAHLKERQNSEIWKERQSKVVLPLLESKVHDHLRNPADITEQFLQHLIGVIDVNCFEIRGPDSGAMRGLYPKGALLHHSCVANTAVAIDEHYQMKIYVNQDVKQGETLTNCYTNVLLVSFSGNIKS